jgi:hypothetical protein
MAARFETHEVFNQSPPYEDIDLYGLDRPREHRRGPACLHLAG